MIETKAKWLKHKKEFIPNVYPWKTIKATRETIFAKQGLSDSEVHIEWMTRFCG